jgi:Mycothiol maleylpyruvate isomerase N-terminal domain
MDWISAVERVGHALSLTARPGTTAELPPCPGWNINELLRHVGIAHHRAALILWDGRTEPPPVEEETSPPQGGSLSWYESGLAALLDAIAHRRPGDARVDVQRSVPTATFWRDTMIASVFLRHGLTAKVVVEEASQEGMVRGVLAAAGVTIVTASTARQLNVPGVVYRPFVDPAPSRRHRPRLAGQRHLARPQGGGGDRRRLLRHVAGGRTRIDRDDIGTCRPARQLPCS